MSNERTITDSEGLYPLAPDTKLYSRRTHHVWWRRNSGDFGPKWEGSGGMFSYHEDFFHSEGECVVLWEPTS